MSLKTQGEKKGTFEAILQKIKSANLFSWQAHCRIGPRKLDSRIPVYLPKLKIE